MTPAVASQREFAITPPDLRKTWLLPGLSLLAAITGIAIAARGQPRVLLALPVLLLVLAVIASGMRRRRVMLGQGTLVVQAGLHTCRVALDDLDVPQARIVDLAEHSSLRPLFKSFGTHLPGLRMGHFRLRDRGRAFVLVTDSSRVLVLRERSGRRLLLSLDKPQVLLDALQAAQHR